MEADKISIIVPVYKVEKHLRRCIDSILKQTYTDFELLLINDGSPDNSGAICDEYTIKDARVRVFHKENEGVSIARNLGLKEAKGEWITFVDSDDHVTPNYLESMLSSINLSPNKLALVIEGCIVVHSNRTELFDYKQSIISKSEFEDDFSNKEFFKHGSPWGKLYLNEIIQNNNIKFDERISNYEDLLFCMEYLMHAETIVYSNKCNYYYNINPNSLARKYYSFNKEILLLDKYIELYHKLFKDCNKNKEGYLYISTFLTRSANSLFQRKHKYTEIITSLKLIKEKYTEYLNPSFFYDKNTLIKTAFNMLKISAFNVSANIFYLHKILKDFKRIIFSSNY